MKIIRLLSIHLPPFHNKRLIQTINDQGPVYCIVLLSGIDGVDTEINALIMGVENIIALDAAPISVQEVATHPMAPFQSRQLFKSSANVPQRLVCI